MLQCTVSVYAIQAAVTAPAYNANATTARIHVAVSVSVVRRTGTVPKAPTAIVLPSLDFNKLQSGSSLNGGTFAPYNAAQNPWPGVGVWRGSGPVGSYPGAWYNPNTDESLFNDLNHAMPKGPHWDWSYGQMQSPKIDAIPVRPSDPLPEIPELIDFFW